MMHEGIWLGAAIVVGYLLGTLPVAIVVAGRWGVDPTTAGSGNPGATNVLRTAGRTAGIVTLAGDVAKGAAAAGIGWAVGGRELALACGMAAVVGHVAPATRRFRGGKGVATGFGMTSATFPLAAVAGVVWFYVIRALMGRPSVASQAAIVTLPAVAAASGASWREITVCAVGAVVVLAKLLCTRA